MPRREFLLSLLLISCSLLATACFLNSDRDSLDKLAPDGAYSNFSRTCPNLAGKYVMIGTATPGMPDHFRVRSRKLGLDTMLAMDISVDQQGRTDFVEVLQEGQKLEFVFHVQDGTEVRKSPNTSIDHVHCEGESLVIRRSRAVTGEGVHGSSLTRHTIRKLGNGDLFIQVEIGGVSKSFIFSWNNKPEHYEATFRRYE